MSVAVKLRLAAALLRAAPDARATLRCVDGRLFLAGGHPACDLTATELRALAQHAAGPGGCGLASLCDVDLCGGVEPLGAGLYRRRASDGVEERWFASTLAAPVLRAALGEGHGRHGPLDACIRPDPAVGACAVRLRPIAPGAAAWVPPAAFDAAAFGALAGCLVAELLDDGVAR